MPFHVFATHPPPSLRCALSGEPLPSGAQNGTGAQRGPLVPRAPSAARVPEDGADSRQLHLKTRAGLVLHLAAYSDEQRDRVVRGLRLCAAIAAAPNHEVAKTCCNNEGSGVRSPLRVWSSGER